MKEPCSTTDNPVLFIICIYTACLQNKGTCTNNYVFIKTSQYSYPVLLLLILYAKYEIPQAQKCQVRQTNVNNNNIIVNKNFVECIIDLCTLEQGRKNVFKIGGWGVMGWGRTTRGAIMVGAELENFEHSLGRRK
jgi:hypothetical protein